MVQPAPPASPPQEPAPRPRSILGTFKRVLARIRGGELSPKRLGRSVALGLMIGCTPLYGFHTLLAAGLAVTFRLDVFVTYLASNISIPPMIPIILLAEVQIGTWLLKGRFLPLTLEQLAPERAFELGVALLVGTLVIGTVVATLGGWLVWLIASRYQERAKPPAA